MSLDMEGFIDEVFESVAAVRTTKSGNYVDGKWVETSENKTPHSVTLQQASGKEIQNLSQGGERILDARRVYVNDGVNYSISDSDLWEFTGVNGIFKTVSLDNRPWRNYCKIIVSRQDK